MQFEIPDEDVKEARKHKSKFKFWQTGRCRLTYKFIPTGIGDIIEVECSCGWKKDYTRVENW